jgi:hypothetical protein
LPNALGEPSQFNSYATNIGFHPNGAISGFAFGNNIAHSLTQTVERTPKLNADGTVLKDLYTYDALTVTVPPSSTSAALPRGHSGQCEHSDTD